ncbi:MAG: 3'-5' exonuclease, partial [Bacteroidota bacterium]|nr:3'-5' exonuclease [Bacteroidota bacterium]
FIDKNDDMLERTIDCINSYLSLGYKVEDIAILCRRGKELTELAHRLKELDNTGQGEYIYNPLSDDAFILSSSDAVNLIVSALGFLLSENDAIAKEHLTLYNPLSINQINNLRRQDYKMFSLFDIVVNITEILEVKDTVFMPAFYDAIKNFMVEKRGGIAEFLNYWESTLKDQKIETSIGGNSLRLTTIHKSKGLEYNVVILPYFKWQLSKTSDSIWIDNSEGKIIDIPAVECRISDLKDTEFQEEYDNEIEMQKRESYNLLYVACTRAKQHLSIIATHGKSPKPGSESNVGDLLYNFLQSRSDTFSQIGEVYTYKNIPVECYRIAKEEEKKRENKKVTMNFSYNAVVFSSPSLSESYFTNTSFEETGSKRLFGTNMHNIIYII